MAKYANGTNYAKTLDPTSANIIDPGLLGGKVRVMKDTSTTTTHLDSGSYIIVGGLLPTGSQVVKVIIGSNATAFQTSSNVQVGDEGDSDRYMTLVSCAASVVSEGPNVSTGMYYTVTGTTDNYIRLTVPTGSSVSSGTINVSVLYTVE